MEVVSCSAVAYSSRNESLKIGRGLLPSLRRVAPPVAATNVISSSSWFQHNLPHSFWLSVEGEQLRRSFVKTYPVRRLSGRRAPPCVAPSASGAVRRVGGSASFPTKVVVKETEVR